MYRIFAVIRKKKSAGRIAFLFLILVFAEVFSHEFLDVYDLAEMGTSTNVETVNSVTVGRKDGSTVMEVNDQKPEPDQSLFNDQSNHHDVLISARFFYAKVSACRSEQTECSTDPVFTTSLSPPYLPPKNSWLFIVESGKYFFFG